MQMYGHMFINVRFNIFIFIISVLLCRPFLSIHSAVTLVFYIMFLLNHVLHFTCNIKGTVHPKTLSNIRYM